MNFVKSFVNFGYIVVFLSSTIAHFLSIDVEMRAAFSFISLLAVLYLVKEYFPEAK